MNVTSASTPLVSIYDAHRIDRLRSEMRLDPHVMRRLHTALFKSWLPFEDALTCIPQPKRQTVADRLHIDSLQLHRRIDSSIDGATKLLFRTAGGLLLESVILRAGSGRITLCVSSQVGCAAACDFCATGKMGIAHNLSAHEILDQVLHSGRIVAAEGRRIRNIVFMGMGEPFHNEENLIDAMQVLTDAQYFHHAPTRILVSTVGIPDAMNRFTRRFTEVNLALSLHSVRQSVREQLIPLARRYPLTELCQTVRKLNSIQSRPVMLEYLMLAGMNDAAEDARELVHWCDGLRVHVNLIPFNTIEDAPHLQCTNRADRDAFAAMLKSSGVTTTIRYSLGADIAAACGQLVRQENRKVNPTGFPIEVVESDENPYRN